MQHDAGIPDCFWSKVLVEHGHPVDLETFGALVYQQELICAVDAHDHLVGDPRLGHQDGLTVQPFLGWVVGIWLGLLYVDVGTRPVMFEPDAEAWDCH